MFYAHVVNASISICEVTAKQTPNKNEIRNM